MSDQFTEAVSSPIEKRGILPSDITKTAVALGNIGLNTYIAMTGNLPLTEIVHNPALKVLAIAGIVGNSFKLKEIYDDTQQTLPPKPPQIPTDFQPEPV